METTFDKSSATNGRLKVILTESDYQAGVDKKLKEYAKTASVKGFRPGHVPLGYVKKLYGKSVLVDTVVNTVGETVNAYIKDNALKVVGDPLPDNEASVLDWENGKEFTFEYELGLASDFEVDLAKLPAIENYEIVPSDEQVNNSVTDLRKRFGVDAEPEEAELGDLLFGTLRQESSEFESQSGIPTDKVKKDSQKLFIGLGKGSKVSFDIQSIFETDKDLGFATGKSDEEAASLLGEYEYELTKISRVEAAELNQEFFDKAIGEGKASNEEEFRVALKEVIKQNYTRESAYLLDYEIEKSLHDNVKIDLPDEFLKKWLLEVNEGKFTAEQIESDYAAFARGLKLDLIKSDIAEKSEIKIEYNDVLEEVKSEIRAYFGNQGYGGMEEFVEQMAKKQLDENKDGAFRNYYNKAFGKAVIAFSRDKVKVENKAVQVEEFNEIAKGKYESIA
ncbi:MAG: trigger factor [Psychromonas sp.]|jgi:trigger factor